MYKNYKESFEKTRLAGAIAARALDEVAKIAIPGTKTDDIDKLCYEFINDHGAYSAPLYYRGFPKSCCTSVNHVVCHGIPSDKILMEGDIVNVDVTAYKNGWHGDTSRTFEIGNVSVKAKKLVKTTFDAMMKAINIIKEDIFLGDIGSTIQKHVEAEGFSVVQDFCGHGIGEVFHKEPNVLHYGKGGSGDILIQIVIHLQVLLPMMARLTSMQTLFQKLQLKELKFSKKVLPHSMVLMLLPESLTS